MKYKIEIDSRRERGVPRHSAKVLDSSGKVVFSTGYRWTEDEAECEAESWIRRQENILA